jgi:hypothetical protein
MQRFFVLRFHFDANGPDETQKLSAHGGDDLRLVFSADEKFSVAQMQSVLCFPGDLFDFRTQTGLALEEVDRPPRGSSACEDVGGARTNCKTAAGYRE